MARVIEIIDSDEDASFFDSTLTGETNREKNVEEEETTVPSLVTVDSTATQLHVDATTENTHETEPHYNEVNNVDFFTGPLADASAKNNDKDRNQRNRRKALHQPMRASPEMEFETIALDDDEDSTLPTKPKAARTKAEKSNKVIKAQPKILVPKPRNEELLDAAHNDFLAADETVQQMRQIAEDRVRINYLLAAYGMPDINFSMRTHPERLRFQLAERLRQLEMRQKTTRPIQRRTLIQSDATDEVTRIIAKP